MAFETENWTRIPARWFTKTPVGTRRAVRLVVMHDMEAPEKGDTAEAVARYFATVDRKASAHVCIDPDSTVQCVLDNDVAYGAGGVNHDGIHLELAGYAAQTRAQWLDVYSRQLLVRAGDVAAQYCLKYGIPVQHLTDEQLRAGARGIIGHVQATDVYRKSDHRDPGTNFPWDYFIAQAAISATLRGTPSTP